jgi:hypothetical protein
MLSSEVRTESLVFEDNSITSADATKAQRRTERLLVRFGFSSSGGGVESSNDHYFYCPEGPQYEWIVVIGQSGI